MNPVYGSGPDEVAGPGSVAEIKGFVIKAGPSSAARAEGTAERTKLTSSLGAVKIELATEL